MNIPETTPKDIIKEIIVILVSGCLTAGVVVVVAILPAGASVPEVLLVVLGCAEAWLANSSSKLRVLISNEERIIVPKNPPIDDIL